MAKSFRSGLKRLRTREFDVAKPNPNVSNPQPATVSQPAINEPTVQQPKPKPKAISSLQRFFDDMEVVAKQNRDPDLRKPAFDIGGPVFSNYLTWLTLAELMKLNKKIDKLLKKNA